LVLRITASKLLKEFGPSGGRIMVTRQTMDRASVKKIEILSRPNRVPTFKMRFLVKWNYLLIDSKERVARNYLSSLAS
jgi:hypothetical protein